MLWLWPRAHADARTVGLEGSDKDPLVLHRPLCLGSRRDSAGAAADARLAPGQGRVGATTKRERKKRIDFIFISSLSLRSRIRLRSGWQRYQALVADGDARAMRHAAPVTGAIRFFVSIIPSGLQMLCQLVGFSADRDGGIALLESGLAGPRSWLCFLLMIWIRGGFQEDRLAALALHQQALGMFGGRLPLCTFLAGYFARELGDMAAAREHFASVERESSELPLLAVACTYETAW